MIRTGIALAYWILLAAACHSTLHTGKIGSGGAGATASTDPPAAGGSAGGSGGNVAFGGTVGAGVGGAVVGGGGVVVALGGSAGGPAGGRAGTGGLGGGIVIAGGGSAGFAGGGGSLAQGGVGGRRGGAGGAGPVGGIVSGGAGAMAAGGVAGQTFIGQYGGGTAPSVVASGSEPSDVRPAAETWTPPFAQPLGTPGWRQSNERLCNANQGIETVSDVWVDERGVFALVASACSENMGVPCGKQGATLKLNSGSGSPSCGEARASCTSPPRWNSDALTAPAWRCC